MESTGVNIDGCGKADLCMVDVFAAAEHAVGACETCKPFLRSFLEVHDKGYGHTVYRKRIRCLSPRAEVFEFVLHGLRITNPSGKMRRPSGRKSLAVGRQTADLERVSQNEGLLADRHSGGNASGLQKVASFGEKDVESEAVAL
jgi:hypothetical protein